MSGSDSRFQAEKKSSLPAIRAAGHAGRTSVLPPAQTSDNILIRIAPGDAGLFRYLLEGAGGHLALLTVLDPKETMLKLIFSPHQKDDLFEFLDSVRKTVVFQVLEWPFGGASCACPFNAAAPGKGMESAL
ncbi:MAG: DUF4911 domain-containing protein [Mailhella sp.]|nr:DUF4911 domain-containing protein [Mailhella sp.]